MTFKKTHFICLTMVLFPDSPAPRHKHTDSIQRSVVTRRRRCEPDIRPSLQPSLCGLGLSKWSTRRNRNRRMKQNLVRDLLFLPISTIESAVGKRLITHCCVSCLACSRLSGATFASTSSVKSTQLRRSWIKLVTPLSTGIHSLRLCIP